MGVGVYAGAGFERRSTETHWSRTVVLMPAETLQTAASPQESTKALQYRPAIKKAPLKKVSLRVEQK